MSEVTNSAILLVDDNRTSLSLRKLMLESRGHNVMAVADAPAALQALRTELISLVILDYFLEGITGTELAGQMRQFKPLVPILLLSGAVEILEGAENVDCCLSKLESFATVEDKIAELLGKSESCTASGPRRVPCLLNSPESSGMTYNTLSYAKTVEGIAQNEAPEHEPGGERTLAQ